MLSDEDDIEACLTTFERMMVAYRVPKDRWVFRVAPQLTGKAQQAYAAMAAEDTGDYDQLKAPFFSGTASRRRRTVCVSGRWRIPGRSRMRKWRLG